MPFLPMRRRRTGQYPIFGFRSELDRLFDDFFGLESEKAGLSAPSIDVSENEDSVTVHAELAGVSNENITLNADQDTLTIRGEKNVERDEKKSHWHITERSHGSFTRVVQLPAPVDADKARASFKDGMLNLHIQKSEKAKPRVIEVKVE